MVSAPTLVAFSALCWVLLGAPVLITAPTAIVPSLIIWALAFLSAQNFELDGGSAVFVALAVKAFIRVDVVSSTLHISMALARVR